MADVHLSTCARCQEDVRSFLSFAKEIEPQLRVRYQPATRESKHQTISWTTWWHSMAWKPVYAAAAVVIGMALVIGAALLLKRRADLQAQRNQPVNLAPPLQTPTPENRAAIKPTPLAVPSIQSPKSTPSPALAVKGPAPLRKPDNVPRVIALNDGQRTVAVNRSGEVSGLENIPAETRGNVADTLTAQNIEEPEIAKELAPTSVTLRGPSSGQPFKLLSPQRTVIVSDQPSFEWEKLAGATAYRVEVGDMRGHEVAKSEALSPDRTSWTPPKTLNRGETYAWNVTAIVDGKEVVSPGGSASEMKFHVLSAIKVQELEQLKKAGSHLALGVFYAREGMIPEAEREFQILVRDNPRASVLKKLRERIQSWHLH